MSVLLSNSEMRVISLVPSWTETLLWAGVDVVGRTRYCIHPSPQVDHLQIVGGTKKVDWNKISHLNPDLVLMDKEENTKEIADKCAYRFHATHITSIQDLPRELTQMSDILKSAALKNLADRWQKVLSPSPQIQAATNHLHFPGLIQWIRPPQSEIGIQKVVYVVWRKPWMCIRSNTFIGSVLGHLGFSVWEPNTQTQSRYPEFNLNEALSDGVCVLLSSEPYDFIKEKIDFDYPQASVALVDGEKFSWFGIRSLQFLEQQVSLPSAT
jgi:ABC-type Fe3+-hydroxamate transport system substrate-binding protein